MLIHHMFFLTKKIKAQSSSNLCGDQWETYYITNDNKIRAEEKLCTTEFLDDD